MHAGMNSCQHGCLLDRQNHFTEELMASGEVVVDDWRHFRKRKSRRGKMAMVHFQKAHSCPLQRFRSFTTDQKAEKEKQLIRTVDKNMNSLSDILSVD